MCRKLLECHDCFCETVILDKFEEIEIEYIKHCPYCGSVNIEVIEKGKKDE